LKAVVLAAGEGTRLRPFTASKPKGMIPVANRPIMEYTVEALVKNDVKDIVMVVGYRKDTVMSYFQDGKRFGARITYVTQDKQLGTAHALSAAAQHLTGDRFLVVAGDNLIDARSFNDLLSKQDGNAMMVTESENPSKYGVVLTSGGRITGVVEKPDQSVGNIINTGVYHFTADVLQRFDSRERGMETGITDTIAPHIDQLDMTAVHATGKWIDAVYPWDLLDVNAAALEFAGEHKGGVIEPGVTTKGPISIGKGSRIRSGCYLEGPLTIGEGCDIGPDVTILPSTSIGDGVEIGPYTRISHCLIMSNSKVGSHSHISHSVLGDGVRLGPGTFAPAGQASVRLGRETFDLPAVGALVGQDTVFGARSVISAGSIIGPGCRIGDGAIVRGSLDGRSIVV